MTTRPQPGKHAADIVGVVGVFAVAFMSGELPGVFVAAGAVVVALLALPLLRRLAPRTAARSVYWPVCIGLSLLGLVFVVSNQYQLTLLGLALCAALSLTGLSLIVGSAGQVNFAHFVFVGVGAYTFGVLAERFNVNVVLGILVAGAAGALSGLVVGLPAVKIRGQLFLAVATISLAVAFGPLLNLEWLQPLIGGSLGLQVFDYLAFPPSMTTVMSAEKWLALLALAFLGIGAAVAAGLKKTSVGRSMLAVRENEVVATSLGVPVSRLKLQVFVISATYAGVAGALMFLLANRFVSPNDFDLNQMIILYVVLVLGGSRSLVGALIGGFLLVYGYQSGLSQAVNGALSGSMVWNGFFAVAIVATVLALLFRFGRVPGFRGERGASGAATANAAVRGAAVAVAAVAAAAALAVALRWVLSLRTFPATGVVGVVAALVLITTIAALPNGIAGALRLDRREPPADHPPAADTDTVRERGILDQPELPVPVRS